MTSGSQHASGHPSAFFDGWAPKYDEHVCGASDDDRFPFAGYDAVLDAIAMLSRAGAGVRVADLGTGTGRLAELLLAKGCEVVGTDFSAQMLTQASGRLSGVSLVQSDLLGEWPGELAGPFDAIVSAYVLHEFDLEGKLRILKLAAERLSARGRIVIGDVGFETEEALRLARERAGPGWDPTEHYWIADAALPACADRGITAGWTQVSHCAGVLMIDPSAGDEGA